MVQGPMGCLERIFFPVVHSGVMRVSEVSRIIASRAQGLIVQFRVCTLALTPGAQAQSLSRRKMFALPNQHSWDSR